MIQDKILTRQETATVKKISGTSEVEATITGNVGALALGKPGDIATRAYGPVVRALVLEADADFGTYVDGKGILVNSNDCAGYSTSTTYPLDAKGLKKGQVGSFLVSGACVIKCSKIAAIQAAMKVQEVVGYTTGANDVCEIEVNGFDNDIVYSSVG